MTSIIVCGNKSTGDCIERKKRGRIMCKAAEVGKIVINRCLDAGIFVDAQKLQKLLVLMQVECIKRNRKPLFKEDVRIWNCGVAIKEVDEEFRGLGEPFFEHQEEYINLLDGERQSVDYVLKLYGNYDALEINSLPIIQKVISLGVITDGSSVPHVNYNILIGAFCLK